MNNNTSLEKALETVKLLSTMEKVKLIKRLTTQIESELKVTKLKPRKSLRGLWKGLKITEDDIAEARSNMWSNSPFERECIVNF